MYYFLSRLFLFLSGCFLCTKTPLEAFLEVELKAEAAILINGSSGRILYEKNAHKRHYPASTTKVATALLALESADGRLDEWVTIDRDILATVDVSAKKRSRYAIPSYFLEPDAVHIGLRHGERLTLRELLSGMLVASACDASNAIAKHLNGSIPHFMEALNQRLQKLGCCQTQLNNPHGLFHPDHYTTAYDLSLIARAAMANPIFRELVKATRYVRSSTDQQKGAVFAQTNKLLRPGALYYPYAIGLKTGWTSVSGYNLVAAAEKGGRLLIAVLLKEKEKQDRFVDAIALFEAAFNEPLIEKTVVVKGQQPLRREIPKAISLLETYVDDAITMTYYPSEEPLVRYDVRWDDPPLPISQGQRVGLLTVKSDEVGFFKEVELKAIRTIEEQRDWSFAQLLAGCTLALFAAWGLILFDKICIILDKYTQNV